MHSQRAVIHVSHVGPEHARAMLHSKCSMAHAMPGGGPRGPFAVSTFHPLVLRAIEHGSLLTVACLSPFRCWKLVACCAVCCRDDLFTSMLPKYHDILRHQADLDILIFSGDVDGIVPVIGTRRWLASLELPIIKEWRPWYSHTGKLLFTLHLFTHRPRGEGLCNFE